MFSTVLSGCLWGWCVCLLGLHGQENPRGRGLMEGAMETLQEGDHCPEIIHTAV